MTYNYVLLRSNATRVDPDQISLQSAISEPELHYLHLRNSVKRICTPRAET